MPKPLAWIVTPTLDTKIGKRTVAQAASTAGILVRTFVALDRHREGGTKAANRALSAATGTPFICYINDDTGFSQQGWLKRLIEALKSNPRYGLASPSGQCAALPGRGKPGMPRKIQIVDNLSFFCVVFKRAVLDKVGLLDERFIHYGCDNDYCHRVVAAGWQCIWVQDVWVEHERSPVIKKWKEHDLRVYRKKWRSKV